MSVDLLNALPPELVPTAGVDDVQDLLVFIDDFRPGEPGATKNASLVAQARAIYVPGHEIQVLSLGGGWNAEAQAIHWIRDTFRYHALGRIVIIGHGVGGVEALSLCRQIGRWFPYYDFTSMNLTDVKEEENVIAETRIDLLITTYAPLGSSADPDRSVPRCVRRALNLYRTDAPNPRTEAPGMPLYAASPATTKVDNVDISHFARQSSSRGALDSIINPQILSAIRQTLSAEGLPAPSSPSSPSA